jgi:hypothetical protein
VQISNTQVRAYAIGFVFSGGKQEMEKGTDEINFLTAYRCPLTAGRWIQITTTHQQFMQEEPGVNSGRRLKAMDIASLLPNSVRLSASAG